MIAAVELDDAGYAVAGAPINLVDRVLEEMYARKIMIRSLGRVVYLMLPLISSADTVAETADRLVETIRLGLVRTQERRRSGMMAPCMLMDFGQEGLITNAGREFGRTLAINLPVSALSCFFAPGRSRTPARPRRSCGAVCRS